MSRSRLRYRIPAVWNCWQYDGPTHQQGREVLIEPADYLRSCEAWIKRHAVHHGRISGRSLSQIEGVRADGERSVRAGRSKRRSGDWIRGQVMYGLMTRAATAWDHDGNGALRHGRVNELGTFLKAILLLPHLRRMGVTLLYLLPVVKPSKLYRKGELGCPYSAKNFFALDPDQQDDGFGVCVGDLPGQFRRFVTGAHRLGMRVMLDVAPRTGARDSDWILDHPEWFYWIDRRHARSYAAPRVPGVSYLNPVPGRLHEIYDVAAVKAHLARFRFAPSLTHPGRWSNFVKRAKAHPPANLLKEIAALFGVITPPGFSDVVNDQQPPWSDVTYLRLHEDHPAEAVKHLADPARQAPYVLYDSAKASLFPGRRPMRGLWRQLSGIIPFYQRFGVDGARVDMAHALPTELEAAILTRPRDRDADFCFLAEQLGTGNHREVYRAGYNIIIGSSWWQQPRGADGEMHKLVKTLPALKVPVMAAAETPDTPRAATRRGGRRFSQQAVVVNCFLPNAVPMVNGGMEIFERQPMNLGLDATERDRFRLRKDDPFYGKLAFFDRFAMHWCQGGGDRMIALVGKATALRCAFLGTLTRPGAYFVPQLADRSGRILATGFQVAPARALLMLANLDPTTARTAGITLPRGLQAAAVNSAQVRLQIHEASQLRRMGRGLRARLAPLEAMVIELGAVRSARA